VSNGFHDSAYSLDNKLRINADISALGMGTQLVIFSKEYSTEMEYKPFEASC
tara:strand:+ start:190618 stop:190773 length:156 start_codon:yes stop_codon:yes gene_type:complete